MAFLLSFSFTLLLGLAFQSFLPWYSIALAGFIAGAIAPNLKTRYSFLSAFLAGLILWGGQAILISLQNEHILASRLGITFGGIGSTGMFLTTGILGAIFAGLGGMTGYLGRNIFVDRR